uniref:Uncharacterized protein n=1 Tax=Spongospora subterranea TaxID=70186 RepID=A0A0H5R420_9EUKA|eukprot:CRZ08883.1 hypothetical protein [Spongospora subterranea]
MLGSMMVLSLLMLANLSRCAELQSTSNQEATTQGQQTLFTAPTQQLFHYSFIKNDESSFIPEEATSCVDTRSTARPLQLLRSLTDFLLDPFLCHEAKSPSFLSDFLLEPLCHKAKSRSYLGIDSVESKESAKPGRALVSTKGFTVVGSFDSNKILSGNEKAIPSKKTKPSLVVNISILIDNEFNCNEGGCPDAQWVRVPDGSEAADAPGDIDQTEGEVNHESLENNEICRVCNERVLRTSPRPNSPLRRVKAYHNLCDYANSFEPINTSERVATPSVEDDAPAESIAPSMTQRPDSV